MIFGRSSSRGSSSKGTSTEGAPPQGPPAKGASGKGAAAGGASAKGTTGASPKGTRGASAKSTAKDAVKGSLRGAAVRGTSLKGVLSITPEQPLGSGDALDAAAVKARLTALGDDGDLARRLDLAVDNTLAGLRGLSDLTVPLALGYLDRIARPLAALDMENAVRLTSRGYAAHLVIEADGRDFGIETVPVLGDLPSIRRGQIPQGLTTRLVKVTRRNFESVRAVNAGTWEGLLVLTAGRFHANRLPQEDGTPGPALDVLVIDALLRFGWVLRQVDLHYGLQPDRT